MAHRFLHNFVRRDGVEFISELPDWYKSDGRSKILVHTNPVTGKTEVDLVHPEHQPMRLSLNPGVENKKGTATWQTLVIH